MTRLKVSRARGVEPEVIVNAPAEPAGALVERARAGDGDAFAAIVRHYDAGLRALAFRLLGSRDRMDDVLQDAYLKAFRAFGGFRGGSSPGTWLYRIVYNACLDDLRRRRAPALDITELHDAASGDPGAATVVIERDRLVRALSRLPVGQRAAVLLVDGQGLDYSEAARALGVPEGTLGSRLSLARAALRGELREGSFDDG